MAAALLPAALLRFCKLPQPLAFGAAALGVFAVGFGIPWYAESSAERAAARLPGESRLEVGQSRPRTIEFVSRTDFYDGSDFDPHGLNRTGSCDAVCQRLLLSREVECVRTMAYKRAGPAMESLAALREHRVEEFATCQPYPAELSDELPEARQARARGACIIAGKPSTDRLPPAEARVERRAVSLGASRSKPASDAALVGLRRIEVTLMGDEGQHRQVASGADFILLPPRTPFFITFEGGFDSTFRPAISKVWKVFRPVDAADPVRTALGYRL